MCSRAFVLLLLITLASLSTADVTAQRHAVRSGHATERGSYDSNNRHVAVSSSKITLDSDTHYNKKAEKEQHDHQHKADEDGPDSYYKEEVKETYYKQEQHECPRPQPADSVKQVYFQHTTFNWAEVAEQQLSAGHYPKQGASSEEPKEPTQQDQEPKEQNSRFIFGPGGGSAPKTPSVKEDQTGEPDRRVSSGAREEPSQQPTNKQTRFIFGPGAKQQSAAKAAVSVSGVSADPGNDKFLLPVGLAATVRGFLGTVSGEWRPTDEALAVGPHSSNPGLVTVLHGVNNVVEIFKATKEGVPVAMNKKTKISLDYLTWLASKTKSCIAQKPSAWYDPQEDRYVILWTTTSEDANVLPLLYVAVSQTENPLGDWIIWVLDPLPQLAPGLEGCPDRGKAFFADYPQASFSSSGVFISYGACCHEQILSTLLAIGKGSLYTVPAAGVKPSIYAATYFARSAWHASLPLRAKLLVDDDYTPFNNFIQPARPQTIKDMSSPPLFVMKVDNSFISIATLTEEPLDQMKSAETAPKLVAQLVGKGMDFSAHEGEPVMPQYDTNITLDSGDTGMLGRTDGIRSYGTVQHEGLLYLTTSEFFQGEPCLPSIYWAILYPSDDMCRVARKNWGVIASEDGLALAYPVIGARKEGGALVAYSYSGAEVLDALGPAYPGVATTIVGMGDSSYDKPTIDIVKLGQAAIRESNTPNPQPWGDYSAVQFCEDKMWFAVPIAGRLAHKENFRNAWQSWIGVQEL